MIFVYCSETENCLIYSTVSRHRVAAMCYPGAPVEKGAVTFQRNAYFFPLVMSE